ncbi:MAG: cupin domain-containing protein [Planctomycetota bacterium]
MHDPRPTVVRQPDQGVYCAWLGHTIRYLALGSETGEAYCLSVTEVDQKGGAPPHRHDFVEAFYVIRGTCEFQAGNQTASLSSGEMISIGSGTAHRPMVTSPDGAELLTLAFPAGFDQFQLQAGQPLEDPSQVPTKSVSEIRESIDHIAADFSIDMHPPDSAFQVEPQIHICRATEGDVVDAVGDRYRFLVEGEQSDGRFAIWHTTISPGGGPPPHVHRNEEEAFFVLDGELIFESEGESFTGGPRTFVNLPRGSKHRFSNQSDQPAQVLILVAPSGLEKMFRRTGRLIEDTSQPIAPTDHEEIARLIQIAPEYGVELYL